MKILITGSSGAIGSALVPQLKAGGHEVIRLLRTHSIPDEPCALWNPSAGQIDRQGLEGSDAVIHLAGKNIAAARWTAAHKQEVRESRVIGTQLLCDTLAQLNSPPRTLIAASATGYYGHRGDEILTEESPPGSGFLAEVCQEWEAATQPAKARGIRVVNLRLGVVLDRDSGALGKMLLPFRLGLGGIVGSGRQYWSWIALDDAIGAIRHCLVDSTLAGPVNCVAPQAVTNSEFTKILGKVLSRPTLFPLPAFAARLVLGEMADALLLSSARVESRRLLASGYPFQYPGLESALRRLLRAT